MCFLTKVFTGWVVSISPNPQAVRDCLFSLFAATLLIGDRSSIRNLRTRHAVVTGTHYMVCLYTGCPRRNVPDFGKVFLMLKYTDITQNTYMQSWTVTEIMAREKWGLLAVPNTATCTADTSRDNASGLDRGMQCSLCLRDALRSQPFYVTAGLSHV